MISEQIDFGLWDTKVIFDFQNKWFCMSKQPDKTVVELYFDHPYWTVMKCDMAGPRFNNDRPDVNDYLRDYQRLLGI